MKTNVMSYEELCQKYPLFNDVDISEQEEVTEMETIWDGDNIVGYKPKKEYLHES